MNEPHCRCPGCGTCNAHVERDAAYAELSKQQPCITAVFDRAVWAAVQRWKEHHYRPYRSKTEPHPDVAPFEGPLG